MMGRWTSRRRAIRRLHERIDEMRVTFHTLGLVAIAACAPAAEHTATADDPAAVTIPLRPYVGRLVTVAAVVGGDSLDLLLDTGGGETLITPQVAAALGCSPRGRSIGFRMSGERVEFAHCDSVIVEIGGRSFLHREIGVWDLMSVLPDGLPPLDGVLALNTFADQPFTLDLDGAELTLETRLSLEKRVQNMLKMEARVATGISGGDLTVFVRGIVDEPGWFLFDSGNLDLVQVAPHMLREVGTVPRELGQLPLNLLGLPPTEATVRVRNIILDGALSETFLRKWTWTFDLASGDVWAASRAVKPPNPD